ncbi:MAG: 3-hydroxyacyl-ACP dehydratase FabZ [Clostridiaceae bacterium]|nr:3-hydroxyacyl-ACP dehydratase FabZ [Clostridiaceae bacterium]
MNQKTLIGKEILDILPHRFPFLLLDRVTIFYEEGATQIMPGLKAIGTKNVSFNEPFFQGHFPGNPIMPGVMILEALAQCACAAGIFMKENKGKLGLFTGVEKLKFRRQVIPGDVLKLEIEFIAFRRGMGKVAVKAYVDETVAVEGVIRFAMIDAVEALNN